jgi:hypothetical protein
MYLKRERKYLKSEDTLVLFWRRRANSKRIGKAKSRNISRGIYRLISYRPKRPNNIEASNVNKKRPELAEKLIENLVITPGQPASANPTAGHSSESPGICTHTG